MAEKTPRQRKQLPFGLTGYSQQEICSVVAALSIYGNDYTLVQQEFLHFWGREITTMAIDRIQSNYAKKISETANNLRQRGELNPLATAEGRMRHLYAMYRKASLPTNPIKTIKMSKDVVKTICGSDEPFKLEIIRLMDKIDFQWRNGSRNGRTTEADYRATDDSDDDGGFNNWTAEAEEHDDSGMADWPTEQTPSAGS